MRRWPWVVAVILVAVGSMLGRGELDGRRDEMAHGAWEAATFAQNARATVHALTSVGGSVPAERWRTAVAPLLADREQTAQAQLVLLRALSGEDPRLDELESELSGIARDMRGGSSGPLGDRRVMARAVRLGRVAGSLARDLRKREQGFARTLVVWQGALLVVVVALLLGLFRAFQRVLLREAQAHSAHLRHLADHDPLTGLGNRRRFERDLLAAIGAATRERPLQVLLCDLNGFKAYNDACGHAAGDALLAGVATRLRAAALPHGDAYRLGGDEFCVLAPGGADLAPALVDAIGADPHGVLVTGSVGAALIPLETADADEALRLADARMYDAKVGATGRRTQPLSLDSAL